MKYFSLFIVFLGLGGTLWISIAVTTFKRSVRIVLEVICLI